jgi:hypothetical protein
MNRLISWLISIAQPLKLDGVKVLMVPGLGEEVELVFSTDVFAYSGPGFMTDCEEQFLHDNRCAILGASYQMQEFGPKEIHMSWKLYQKLRRAIEVENKWRAFEEQQT